jgi:hypothetical protein
MSRRNDVLARPIRRWDFALIGVILVAAVARLSWPGLYQLKWDEVRMLTASLRLARYGEWAWLSNNTSWANLPGHSPFNTYLISLPYLFTGDPRVPRLLIGVMGTLAAAVIYVLTRRYFGRPAALVAGLLIAVDPQAVEWSSYVWNPNIAQVFIALWLLTGLLGYYEGKPWAQAVHWLMWSLAFQAHPGNVLLLPLSLLLLAASWFRSQADRRSLLRYTALGWALVVLSLVPWIVGLIKAGFLNNVTNVASDHPTYSSKYVWSFFSNLVSATDYWTIARAHASAGNWWPSLKLDRILWIKTWLTVLGAVWLLVDGWRKRWQGFPGAFLALVTLFPLVAFPVSPITVVDFYLMPIVFGALVVQGAVLAKLAQVRPWTRVPIIAIVAVFLIMQGWLVIGTWRWLSIDGTQEAFRAPMSVHLNLLKEWARQGADIALLTETREGKYGPTEQGGLWQVVGEDYPVRIVRMPQGVPIHPAGQVIVGTYNGTTIPALFGPGETAGALSSGQPIFRWVRIPPGYQPTPDFVPEGPSRFGNGARILGIQALGDLQPGQPWPLLLSWQPERSNVKEQFQFSVRLVDKQDNTYGQVDVASLNGWLWHAGDIVLNRLELPVSQDLHDGNLRVQLLMYTWPEIVNASVVDDAGNNVAPWMYLPVGRNPK